MYDKTSAKSSAFPVLALVCLLTFATGMSYGADYYLQAGVATIPANTFNNPADITVWGYALCDSGWNCDDVMVPGPELTAVEGDPLNIYLRNALAGSYVEPTSVVIPGQAIPVTVGGDDGPVWIDTGGTVVSTGSRPGGDVTSRVRSFTTETPADNSTVIEYQWLSVKAGTYLYQSGTHAAVQVQMGLYGALKVYSVAPVGQDTSGRAYDDPSSAFASEATLLFSEIDPALHNAVATGNYGPGTSMTSTVDYHPKYFLINGQAFSLPAASIPGGEPGNSLLLRFLNAGLSSKVPVVQGPYMSLIAEDGNFKTAVDASGTVVPAPKEAYSVLLTAGKTMDALLVTPAAAGNIPVYDRRLNLSNGGAWPGGMMAYIQTGAAITASAPGPKPKKKNQGKN